MSNLVGCTNSYIAPDGPPQHPLEVNDDEWLPLPSGAPGPAADAASCHHEHTCLAKRTHGVNHSSSATSAPSERRRHDKRQKTHEAREDLCCFCLIAASCSSCNCPCAKAGRPCQRSDPGECNRCTNTVAVHNRAIRIKNARQTTSIAARFMKRVGQPFNPLIPLYDVPPPCNADDNEMDVTVVEINNPPGDAKECNNNRVVLFNVSTALPALDEPLEDDDNDDALPTALGLLANGSNAVVTTTVSLAANRINAPPALGEDDNAAGAGPGGVDGIPVGNGTTGNYGALGPPANGSTVPPALAAAPAISTRRAAPLALPNALGSPANANGFVGGHIPSKGAGALAEDDDAACAGSGGINGIPVGNCATGNDGPLGPPTNGSAVPPALVATPAITTGSAALLASPNALGSPANANGLAGEHEAMDKGSVSNACAAILDGATGDRLPSPTATGGADPLTSHTALDGSDDGGDDPSEFSTDVSMPANESGSMGIGNAADAGSSGIGDDPMQQSTAVYPLFCHGNAEAGRRPVAAVGWMRTAPQESHPPAAVAVLPVNAG
jgi:hypothetical protein